jgi:hypothetical protein
MNRRETYDAASGGDERHKAEVSGRAAPENRRIDSKN